MEESGIPGRSRQLWYVGLCSLALAPPLVVFISFYLRFVPGADWLAWCDVAGDLADLMEVLGAFAAVLILLGYVITGAILGVSAIRAPTPRSIRSVRLSLCLALLVGAASMFLVQYPAQALIRWKVRRIQHRAEPLVLALERHHDDTGHYPASLEELVPGYLESVPSTGMLGHPRFTYERSRSTGEWQEHHGGRNPAYHLRVQWGWYDSLHYWPSEDYPAWLWGGDVEVINGWAYVQGEA